MQRYRNCLGTSDLASQRADGEVGRLLFTRRAKGAGMVIVQFESFTEEVPAEGLRVVGVK